MKLPDKYIWEAGYLTAAEPCRCFPCKTAQNPGKSRPAPAQSVQDSLGNIWMNVNRFEAEYYLENWAGVELVAGGGAIACDSGQPKPSGRPAASTRGLSAAHPRFSRVTTTTWCCLKRSSGHSWISFGCCAHALAWSPSSPLQPLWSRRLNRRQCACNRRPAVCCENFKSTIFCFCWN